MTTSTELKILQHDTFGALEVLKMEDKFYFPATESATVLGYKNARDAIRRHCLKEGVISHTTSTSGGNQSKNFISEGNLYRLITKSKLPAAIDFEKWVFDTVIPSLRSKGGIVTNAEKFADTLFPHITGESKALLTAILSSVQEQNAIITQQQQTIAVQQHDLKFNEEVITSLTDDVELMDKRALLTKIILKAGVAKAQERWHALYRQFEAVYHVRLQQRLDRYNSENKPKLQTKLDYIQEVMDRIDDLYAIAVRMYEADVEVIRNELVELRKPNPQMAFDFGDAEIH